LEAGNRSVSTLELVKLVRLYVRSVAELLREDAPDEDVLVALYRVAPGLKQDTCTYKQVVRCVELCREGVRLKRLLRIEPRSGAPSYETRLPRSPVRAVAQGEQTAMRERGRGRTGPERVPRSDS